MKLRYNLRSSLGIKQRPKQKGLCYRRVDKLGSSTLD